MKYILYAAYGSNMQEERFMVYITGGVYNNKKYTGCIDKEKPQNWGYMFVPYRLYFAKSSSIWNNKGVAFLSCEKEAKEKYYTLVRLWKIKETPFYEIHNQEGIGFYPKKLFLGNKDGMEIYTITGCWYEEKNSPSEKYLEIIKKGIKETTNWSDKQVERYLSKFVEAL